MKIYMLSYQFPNVSTPNMFPLLNPAMSLHASNSSYTSPLNSIVVLVTNLL